MGGGWSARRGGGSGRGSRSSPQKERMARTPARRGLLLTYICFVVGDGRSGESHRPLIHGNSTSTILCKEEEEGDDDDEERRKGVGGGRKEGSE